MITYAVDPKLEKGTWRVNGEIQGTLSAKSLGGIVNGSGVREVRVAPDLHRRLRTVICGLAGTMTEKERKAKLAAGREAREKKRNKRRAAQGRPVSA